MGKKLGYNSYYIILRTKHTYIFVCKQYMWWMCKQYMWWMCSSHIISHHNND
jgi:hypothetical protein